MKYVIDHIVMAVPNLDMAVTDFYERTGVRPVIGGRHTALGTANALIGLDNGAYLELLAVDPATHIQPPRWMGVDLITTPRITRWALKSDDIHRDVAPLRRYDPSLAAVQKGQRKMTTGDMLEWSLTMPLPAPIVEVAPFFLDWSRSSHHPADKLESACTLTSIKFTHPPSDDLDVLFAHIGFQDQLKYDQAASIEVVIESPLGAVILR